MKKEELYEKAIVKWGDIAQIFMLFEEVAELMVSICHSHRKNKVTFKSDLISEIVDVEVMLEQMKILFNITDCEIHLEKIRKLKRLEKLLND